MSLGAGHSNSDSCIITMSPPPMSSTTKHQDKGIRPHIRRERRKGRVYIKGD